MSTILLLAAAAALVLGVIIYLAARK